MSAPGTPVKYIHLDSEHNLQSPKVIVPFLVNEFSPVSVADVGCGIGTFLHVFKAEGVKDILGFDGKWVDRDKLYIDQNEFQEVDLEKPIVPDRRFDLVICLEVAEHLSENCADTIVESLVSLGDKIVFSAAIKNQGGQNHINEQYMPYWTEKFEKRGYKVIDFFRPVFWNNTKVQWWYKQNMFLVLHPSIDSSQFEKRQTPYSPEDTLIHPELYEERLSQFGKRNEEYKNLAGGKAPFGTYVRLLLRNIKSKFR